MLVIGSVALSCHPNYKDIKPNDVDVLLPSDSLEDSCLLRFNGLPLEVTVSKPGSTDQFLVEHYSGMAPLDVLYWLKMSHRYKKDSPHFNKTRLDILKIRDRNPEVADVEPEWFVAREKETYAKTPKLNVSKEAFFDTEANGVVQHYDHDWLHTVVSRLVNGSTIPSYTRYIKDGAQVACDRVKFYSQPALTRLHGVMEEAMVLALERSIIPLWIRNPAKINPEWAYRYALQKVCTSITGGWFREFAWENYDRALWNVDRDYWNKAKVMIEGEGVRLV